MRQNLLLFFCMVLMLYACGGKRNKAVLNSAPPPAVVKTSAVPADSSFPHSPTEELSLVLPLPRTVEPKTIATELEAYKPLLIGLLKTEPNVRLCIETHCALLGSPRQSMEYSMQTGQAVRAYLLEGTTLDPARIHIRARGSEVPLFASTSSYGRSKNNRMELTLENLPKPGQPFSQIPFGDTSRAWADDSSTAMDPVAGPDVLSHTFTFRFPKRSSELSETSMRQVQELAVFLKQNPGTKALINGYTDNVGNKDANERLSYQRGLDIQIALLTQFNIPPERTEVKGYGESRPIADNSSALGRSLNRRVEVTIEPFTSSVWYAGIAPTTVVPGESASPVEPKCPTSGASSMQTQSSKGQRYRHRLECLAKSYGGARNYLLRRSQVRSFTLSRYR